MRSRSAGVAGIGTSIALPQLRVAIGGIVLAAFLWPAIEETALISRKHTAGVYREVATLLTRAGLRGPIAATNRYAGGYVALYRNDKMVLIPPPWDHAKERQAIESAIVAAKPGVILVWTEPSTKRDWLEKDLAAARDYGRKLAQRLGYTLRLTYDRQSRKVEVFGPPIPKPPAS